MSRILSIAKPPQIISAKKSVAAGGSSKEAQVSPYTRWAIRRSGQCGNRLRPRQSFPMRAVLAGLCPQAMGLLVAEAECLLPRLPADYDEVPGDLPKRQTRMLLRRRAPRSQRAVKCLCVAWERSSARLLSSGPTSTSLSTISAAITVLRRLLPYEQLPRTFCSSVRARFLTLLTHHRLTATRVQMASTTPNGHAPCKKP